jgi:hypothetical protein
MPFTVAQLRVQMDADMVASGMLTAPQLAGLLNAPNVDAAVNALPAAPNWLVYWNALGVWIAAAPGNIQAATLTPGFGLVLPPALPPNYPANHRGLVILLNDCFDDTWAHMNGPGFLPAQALANHIRLLRLH